MKVLDRAIIRAAALALSTTICLLAANQKTKLSGRYDEFLNGPPSYLITRIERAAFSNLKADAERDAFIERFWEIRDPAAGSGDGNEFKEEFYRRVAWVNAYYGKDAGGDGWRTDRGKTYILFGKPQTTTNYIYNQELYPIELWFYSNPGLTELPPFFYVMFYERDGVSGYRFYHPYVDGPDKLLRAGGTKAQAFQYLRNISPELASASLTLIPGEPLDTDNFSGSMGSATIVNAIQGYREMPSYVAVIQERARRLERVTSRIQFDVPRAAMVTFVAKENGQDWLHWRMEINDPLQPKAKMGKVNYEIRSRLLSGTRLVFERTDSPAFTVPDTAQEELKKRPFVYEDRMPVVPGKYRLIVTAVNGANAHTYESSKEFSVSQPDDRAALSDVLITSRHEPDARSRPFQFGGVKFSPMAAPRVEAVRGLSIVYQVILTTPPPPELQVQYVIGSVSAKLRKTFEDKLDARTADAFGSIVTAKTLALQELGPGNYQLAIRVTDSQSGKISARSVPFTISRDEEELKPILVSRGATASPQWTAANHYERALCWLSQNRPAEALADVEASWKLSKNPAAERLLRHLQAHQKLPKAATTTP